MPETLRPDENERVRAAMERLKNERYEGSGSEMARDLGLKQPQVSKFLRGLSGTSEHVAAVVARAMGIPLTDLLSNRSAQSASPEPTPHTPPVKSDTRLISSHWETPEVEGWFASAIRHAVHEPTGKQITVSKVFTREKMTRMVDGVDMVDFVLSVLEAARDLDERGQLGEAEDPATHTRIMAWLAAQSRARRTPRELAHAADRKARLLAEAQESPEDEPPSAEPVKTVPRKAKGAR